MTSPTPYQLLPRLSDDEYEALRTDIAANGVRVPIDVDEDGTILDGHHRAWITADLGVECPKRTVSGLTDEQKRTHAVAVNIHRRSLSREQKRELIQRSVKADPHLSDRQHAERTGSDHKTVATQRVALEGRGEIPHIEERVDTRGRQQPANKARPGATPGAEPNLFTGEDWVQPKAPEFARMITPAAAPATGPASELDAFTGEERILHKQLIDGETIVVSFRRHQRLIAWAEAADLYVRVDRRTPWGNPFELPGDGTREQVIAAYSNHYLPYKPSLLDRLHELTGKALGCWCAPEACHADVLKNGADEL